MSHRINLGSVMTDRIAKAFTLIRTFDKEWISVLKKDTSQEIYMSFEADTVCICAPAACIEYVPKLEYRPESLEIYLGNIQDVCFRYGISQRSVLAIITEVAIVSHIRKVLEKNGVLTPEEKV